MRDRSSDSKSVRHGTPFGPAEFAAADGPGIGFTVSGDAVAQIATARPIATAEIPTRSDEGASAMDVTKRLDPVVRANPRTDGSSPPAPRGSSPPPRPRPRFRVSRGWILIALALLAVNLYAGTRAMQPALRVRVPYRPFFLQQVNAGHVKEITSKGMAVQGTFTVNESYGGSKPTTRFQTEIPRLPTTTPCRACSSARQWSSTLNRWIPGRRGGRTCCSGSGRRSCSWRCCSG